MYRFDLHCKPITYWTSKCPFQGIPRSHGQELFQVQGTICIDRESGPPPKRNSMPTRLQWEWSRLFGSKAQVGRLKGPKPVAALRYSPDDWSKGHTFRNAYNKTCTTFNHGCTHIHVVTIPEREVCVEPAARVFKHPMPLTHATHLKHPQTHTHTHTHTQMVLHIMVAS